MANFNIAHDKYLSCCAADGAGWHAADFKAAQEHVKKVEGGYTDDPDDNGNWTGGKIGLGELIGTNWGISAPTLATELKRVGGNPPTASTMKNLEYASAVAIYKRNFWDRIKGDDIKNQWVAEIIYDAYVNQSGWTRKMLEDTLQNTGKPTSVSVPLKKDTIDAINSVSPAQFFNEFKKQRKLRYEETSKRPNQAKYLKGWMNRLSKFDNQLLETVKKNYGKTIMIALGIGLLITGIYYYRK